MIIEEIPYKQIKIQTKDGNVFLYSYDDIERKTKEKSLNTRVKNSNPFRYSYSKEPRMALYFSAIPGLFGISGGGQFYNGQPVKGCVFLLTGITFLLVGSQMDKEESDLVG